MQTAVGEPNQQEVQRSTTKRKAALILSVIKGETSIQEAARQHGERRSVVKRRLKVHR